MKIYKNLFPIKFIINKIQTNNNKQINNIAPISLNTLLRNDLPGKFSR